MCDLHCITYTDSVTEFASKIDSIWVTLTGITNKGLAHICGRKHRLYKRVGHRLPWSYIAFYIKPILLLILPIDNQHVPSRQFWLMVTLFRVFPVKNTQKWFTLFFWGHPVQLAQGHTGWLFWHAQWGTELPTSGSAARYLTHGASCCPFSLKI